MQPSSSDPCGRAFRRAAASVAVALLATASLPAAAAPQPGTAASRPVSAAPVGDSGRLSAEAARTADWIRATGDNRRLPFAIVDKRSARLHVFDADGRALAATPVLLGQARGDRSVPGIGERRIAEIRPHERTTPAGRFASEPGRNLQDEDIVWIDYDAAVSMHRIRPSRPSERRPQRLATATPADNRISYGCVNVPRDFYDRHVQPVFGRSAGVVYVLPETQSAASFFPMGGPAAAPPAGARPSVPGAGAG
jgi:hypothetical protein